MNSRWIRVAIAGLVVTGGTCLWVSPTLKAQSEDLTGAFAKLPTNSERRVRLAYDGASWERVLEDFSRQVGRQLVMDSVPRGRVTRRDRTQYTVTDALRLLNTELKKDGYRVLLQKKHVILLKSEAGEGLPSGRERTPIRDRSASRAGYTGGQQNGAIRRTGSYQEDTPRKPAPRNDGPWDEQTFKIANQQAADVARSIYDVFATRSSLNTSGINGLPSFTVFHRDDFGRTSQSKHFEVGIDRERNSLTVAAPANTVRQLVDLIRELDQPVKQKQGIRVVETNQVKAKTTQELQQELDRLSRLARTSFRPNRDNMFFAQNSQDGTTPSAPQAGPGEQKSMNLQGDVVLQPLDDIDAVVIKGNQDDIDTVVSIINELEKLSEGTLPEVSLVELKSVNSEALAELLTTVYDNLSELREGGGGTERKQNIGFVPVVKPNAILVLAPRIELENDIKKLIEKLDRPVNPTYEFEVFQLKNAIASQVIANLTSLYEEPAGLGTRIRAVADVRTNSVIVQARPTDLEEVAGIIERIDLDRAGKISRVKVIKLRNAVAEELAETISTAIQNIINPPQTNVNFGQTGATELRDSASVVLEFLTKDGDIERLIRSGILVDVRVQADIRSNSLIVAAPDPSMELMEALIRQLDGAPPSVADIKVFTLTRADATQAVELLTGLFEDQNNEDEVGVAFAGTNAAESTLVPVRFSADIRTNTVVAAGSIESLAIVEAILLRLDETPSRARDVKVHKLNNIGAEATAERLNEFLETQSELLDENDLRSGVERLDSEILINYEEISNSLIVSASPEYHEKLKLVIDQLDANPRQVVIQALIVEVELDNTDEFGIELGFQDPLLFARGADPTDGLPGLPGFFFNSNAAPGSSSPVRPDIIGSQGISNFGLGRLSGDAGVPGFVFSASSEAVNVLIRALAARRNVQILSRPQIRTQHNQLGKIQVGRDVPIVTGGNVSQFGTFQPIIEYANSGIILDVKPIISADGNVMMDVYAEKSDFTDGIPVFTDANGASVESPIKNVTTAEGRVMVPSGNTVVVGGMISKSDSTIERKVPWLGDVPILGSAFRFDGTTTRRTELLIFLTPRIVDTDADSELIKQIEADRIHYIESEAEEMHGPLFSVPGSSSGTRGRFDTEPLLPSEGLPIEGPSEFDLNDAEPVESGAIQPTSGTKPRRKRFGIAKPGTWLRNRMKR